jgi:hypothetical protein
MRRSSITPMTILCLGLFMALACESDGGGAGSRTDDTSASDAAAQDAAVDAPQVDAQAEVAADMGEPPIPEITPTTTPPDPGTFVFEEDDRAITLTVGDGKVYLRRVSFMCTREGDPPCTFSRKLKEMTCNESFSKGYLGALNQNHASFSVKTDALEVWVTDSKLLEGTYTLTNESCCVKSFYFKAVWSNPEACEGADVPDCDPYTNANCEGDTHCAFDDAGLPVCVPNGPVELGGDCEGMMNGCVEGTCLNLGGTGARCYRYCKQSSDCGAQACIDITDVDWKVCALSSDNYEVCDLLNPTCGEASDGCYLTGLTNSPICLAGGAGQVDDPCESGTDCKAGLACHLETCRELCNTQGGEPSCSDAFDDCISIYGVAGVCN